MCTVIAVAAFVFFGISAISALQLLADSYSEGSAPAMMVVGFIGGAVLVWLYSTLGKC